MGREIKRVALDFNWPMGKVWTGFVNPHYGALVKCPTCGGDGASPACNLLNALWYEHRHEEARALMAAHQFPPVLATFAATVLANAARLARVEHYRGGWGYNLDQSDVDALLDAERLWDFTRVPRTEEQRETVRRKLADGGNSWLPESNGCRPTADEVNRWSRVGMRHDGHNAWICIKARLALFGLDSECPAGCEDGHVPDPETEAKIGAWTETQPPAGDGWQLWETVSEGSPVSPVFSTPERLAAWLAAPGNDTSITRGRSAAQWLAFITGPGWAPSMVGVGGRLMSGVEAATEGVKADGLGEAP